MPRIDRRQHLVAALAMWMGASAAAASGSDTRQAALYAANAAALSAAMTWCEARHGELRRGSAGEECFQKARGVLGGFGLDKWAGEIAARCSDMATFNTCLTPEIARLVRALNEEFRRRQL